MMITTQNPVLRLPSGMRKKLGSEHSRNTVHALLRKNHLNTVCEEAKCPNIGECFANKTATFMILGDRCTRRCHFCSVKTGRPMPPHPDEAAHLVEAIVAMGLDHVVITSVDRDDLPDCGAYHFARCISEIRTKLPHVTIELLTPDFKGKSELIDVVLAAGPHIFGHNIETVERLYKKVRPQSHWDVTSSVLKYVAHSKKASVKSGMMVGLGESNEEVSQTLSHLVDLGVEVATIGQYLRPSLKHWPVVRYVEAQHYQDWVTEGQRLGLRHVYAGPFVRSSYHAKETFLTAQSN